jgi:hypothetical protein
MRPGALGVSEFVVENPDYPRNPSMREMALVSSSEQRAGGHSASVQMRG